MVQPITRKETTMRNNQPQRGARQQTAASKQPTHVVKMARTDGERTTHDRLGVAWTREDGSLYVRLHGTQIIADGFSIYPIDGGAQ
jgi:hypothetical protein